MVDEQQLMHACLHTCIDATARTRPQVPYITLVYVFRQGELTIRS